MKKLDIEQFLYHYLTIHHQTQLFSTFRFIKVMKRIKCEEKKKLKFLKLK